MRQLDLFRDVMPSGELTAYGVHTYAGGMEMGVLRAPRVKVLGSYEEWTDGIRAREALAAAGLVSVPLQLNSSRLPRCADVVFANPPCSRFSLSAQYHFDEDDKDDVHNFQPLMQVLNTAFYTSPKAVWWETGPIAWSKGRGMVASCHRVLQEEIFESPMTTLMLRLDLRYLGVPQRRPRCHVIHFAQERMSLTREPLESGWPPSVPMFDFVRRRLKTTPDREIAAGPANTYGGKSPKEIVRLERLVATIQHTRPMLLTEKDWYAPAVLSGRPAAWEETNRWLTLEEWCVLMSFDPAAAKALMVEYNDPLRCIMYLSKGVSPSAAQFVMEDVVEPGIKLSQLPSTATLMPEANGLQIYECDMSVVEDKEYPRQPTKPSRRGRKPREDQDE